MFVMQKNGRRIGDETKQYVTMRAIALNSMFLLCHILFLAMYYIMDVPFMFGVNIVSIVVYLITYRLCAGKRIKLFPIIVILEIWAHMVFSVICVGWEYGFQNYCFGAVSVIMFADFYTSVKFKIRIRAWIISMLYIVSYIALRIWTYQNEPVYQTKYQALERGFFLGNSLMTLGFIAFFIIFYASTVYQLERELKDIAEHDALTGLLNRRCARNVLNATLEDKVDFTNEICLAIMDIDNFKIINDTYGHQAGDETLVAIANILKEREEKNPNLITARWGGEEFTIIYTSGEDCRKQAVAEMEMIRKLVADKVIKSGENELKVTATIGMAFSQRDTNMDELLKRADDNLYLGKAKGKNRIVY